jgi:cytochrome c oxidase subunit 1
VSVAAPRAPLAPVRGLAGAVVGTDHKAVAARTFLTALGFFLLGGVVALMMRWELATPGMQLTSRAGYDQLFSMHGSTMIYLFVTPVALALGTYFVPLQVGAAEIAGPRVNLAGYWLLVFGGLIAWSSFLARNGAAQAGWTAEFPMSDAPNVPGTGMDLWIAGVMLATVGAILLAYGLASAAIGGRASARS